MTSKLPIVLTLVFLSLISWAGNPGTPPQPLGDKARFVIVAGQIEDDNSGKPHPTMFRMDTWTGECWKLAAIPLVQQGKVASQIPFWMSIEEHDGDLVKLAYSLIIPAPKPASK